jgi:hypothetical protein
VTISDLCTTALQRLGILQAGETPSNEDSTLALARLNSLIDSWRTARLFDYSLVRTTWAITASTGSYSVGTGSTVNVQRPAHVLRIRLIDTSVTPNLEMSLGEPLTEAQYQAIPQKALTSPYPQRVFYNPTLPTGTITFWPVPTSTTLQGVIYTPNASGTVALTDTLAVPPGYQLFYEESLAIHMAPDFEREPSTVLVRSQQRAESAVKRSNLKLADLVLDTPFVSRQYDINAGP